MDRLPEWWLLVPSAHTDDCLQANPMASINLWIKRKPGYYVRVGFFMLALLTTLGFTSHCLSLEDTPDRINNIVAVIFTVLSLRFSLAEGISNVNYMTSIDRYMMVCMMMLFWLTITHAGVSGLTRRVMSIEQQDLYDHIVERVDAVSSHAHGTSIIWRARAVHARTQMHANAHGCAQNVTSSTCAMIVTCVCLA